MTSQTAFWDKLAERYSRRPIQDMEAYTASLDRTKSYLEPSHTALELGCGTGGTARLLAPHVTQITGTDISPEMIRIARDRNAEEGIPNADFHVGSAADLPDTPGQYDVVLAHNLFHLVENPQEDFSRVAGVLKPGGLFISKTPCLREPGMGWGLRLMLWAIPLMQMLGKAPKITYFSIAELEEMITQAGFSIIETGCYPASPPNRYIVARRA